MKTFSLIFSVALVLAGSRGYGQKISLKENNESLPKVFHDIEKQTALQFFFADSDIRLAKKISINVKDDDLSDILSICFKDQPLIYSVSGNTVMIKLKYEDLKKNENLNTPLNYINGRVTDSLGNPLSGASITIKGSRKGTTTDGSGNFVLTGVKDNAIILISFTGFETRQIALASNPGLKSGVDISGTPFNLALKRSVSPLDQVQIIAYGTTTKRLNTGDVTTITSKVIEQQPVANPLLALEGRVAGAEIYQSNGLPGSAVTVQIRGQNSIANGSYPLYIIDGVPYTAGNLSSVSASFMMGSSTPGTASSPGSPFNYIDPYEIESINILKDADATAIYGTRGANGVVMIITKKGKIGKTQVDINVQNGWGHVADHMKLLNTQQYLKMRHEAFNNDGTNPNPNVDYDLTLWDTTRYTDWQKELIGGTAGFTDIHSTISGGNANTQFLISAGYNKQATVFPGDFSDRKSSINFNINNTSPNQKFKIQLSGIFTTDNNQLPTSDLTQQAIQLTPDAPALYKVDGTINWAENATGTSTWPNFNPAAIRLTKYNSKTNNLVSNAVLSYRIISGLEVKSSFGYTNTQTNDIDALPLTFWPPSARSYSIRTASFADNNLNSWIVEPQMNYTKNISKGIFTALVGSTIEQNNSNSQVINASGFASDLVLEDLAAATSITPYTTIIIYKYNSLFGRLNYNWLDKYLINITTRRDGSSRFGPKDQFHNFWSVGAAWIFSKEAFIPHNLPFLSFGKLRGSYGTTGSDQVGDYTFMDQYIPSSVGVPYQSAIGYYPNRLFTPDLSWEETKKLEVAVELGFLQNRIFFSANYYRNRSANQLLGYTLPAITGFTFIEKNIDATLQNKGWEFELNTVNVKVKNFQWTSSINLSMNRNELVSGSLGLSNYYTEKIGHPIISTFVYHFLGVNTFTGLYEFADNKGKPTSAPNPATDAIRLIDPTTKYYGGFSNNISYKGFEFDFLFQFVEHPLALNYLYSNTTGSFNNGFGGNQPIDVLGRWQQPGDVSKIQKFSQNLTTEASIKNAQASDQVYSDGSYIILKNISISWNIPSQWATNIHIQNAKIYMQGRNLLTFTNYEGLNPETGSSNTLPPLRAISFGFQMTF